ncbi:MAG: DUF86 domain-containing protein [Desulfobacteraceae bacterium]
MKRDDSVFLKHIRDSAVRIEKYIEGFDYNEFSENELVQDAVIRQLEIIGEAVKKISPYLKVLYSEIPWKDIAGMRDKLIHDYFGVDIETVWLTAFNDIPEIYKKIISIINNIS